MNCSETNFLCLYPLTCRNQENFFSICRCPLRPAGLSPTTFSFDSSCSKVAFINFNFPFKRRFQFTKFSNPVSHGSEIRVDGIAVEMGKCTDLDGVQIQRKQLDLLSKFLLRNSGTFNIPVSHSYCGIYSFSC